jgi:phage-related protein
MKYRIVVLEPAYEFISSLEVKLRAKTYRTIDLLGEFGPFLKEPHSKSIKGYKGLFELRIKQGSNNVRLFYYHHKAAFYIITSGYHKKTQKTDANQIMKAVDIMKSYLENQDEEE